MFIQLCKLNIVDSIMGSGKTTAAINYVNALPPEQKVMFIVLYNDEVKRIKKSCKDKNLQEPQYENGRKLYGLRELLSNGENIVSTHALLELLEEEDIRLIKEQNYICFIDETINCISSYNSEDSDYHMHPKDIEVLMKCYSIVDEETGLLQWNVPDYKDGRFIDEKKLMDNRRLMINKDGKLFKIFPLSILMAFKELFVLTYMFEGSVMYCYVKQHGISYRNMYITGSSLDELTISDNADNKVVVKKNYRELIHILDDDKLNSIGDGRYDLSVSWYSKRATERDKKKLQLNMRNFFEHKVGVKAKECLWTTFSSQKSELSAIGDGKYKRYSDCFASINMRASNNWSDRTAVAYLVNRFMNLDICNYFEHDGVRPDQNLFALSEMLQFIWRSAIRKNQPINLYIPSSRMRGLLEDWIEENSYDE